MELLTPSQPPQPAVDRHPALSSPNSALADVAEEGGGSERVFVAVGRSARNAVALLRWSFRMFGGCELCLVHVHQPSPTIPCLLGNLPEAQANAGVVAAYRKEEQEGKRQLLDSYLNLCRRRKVKASIITIEAQQVGVGLVDLIVKHCIRKLVFGALPKNCMRGKKTSSKATYAANKSPSSCQIWFVHKGIKVWTREAFQPDGTREESLRSKSLRYERSKPMFHDDHVRFCSSRIDMIGMKERMQGIEIQTKDELISFHKPTAQGSVTTARSGFASNSCSLMEEELLQSRLAEAKAELEKLEEEAYMELRKREIMEGSAVDAIRKAKDLDAAHALRVEVTRDAEDALKAVIDERDKTFHQKLEIDGKLQKARTNITLLSNHVQEADFRCNAAAEELISVQESIAGLNQEKEKIEGKFIKADSWLARWRTGNNVMLETGYSGNFKEFSVLDLESATCNFSSCFRLGEGRYGCVYKGELSGKTVAIKQLNVHNMQGLSHFQKEKVGVSHSVGSLVSISQIGGLIGHNLPVSWDKSMVQALAKLRHPHLITLIGACPNGSTLVYDYLPNGNLHTRLFNKNTPLTWKTRTRIISEISCALLFLHSSSPENIVHGNLNPKNILLDSKLSCKISDLGIHRLLTSDVLTPKSDVYSFGTVILQLITGRSDLGLLSEVHRAVSRGDLCSILDPRVHWPANVVDKLVSFGLDFCRSNSNDRPSLTPGLVRELQRLHDPDEQPPPSAFLCPIRKDIMLDPVLAADGNAYEREALEEWLQNGRGTSPLTNLPLQHLHLTPSHTLRLAIQGWLCESW